MATKQLDLAKKYGIDSVIAQHADNEYIVWDTEQIHILGSPKDIKQFKEWKNMKNSDKSIVNVKQNNAIVTVAEQAVIDMQHKAQMC